MQLLQLIKHLMIQNHIQFGYILSLSLSVAFSCLLLRHLSGCGSLIHSIFFMFALVFECISQTVFCSSTSSSFDFSLIFALVYSFPSRSFSQSEYSEISNLFQRNCANNDRNCWTKKIRRKINSEWPLSIPNYEWEQQWSTATFDFIELNTPLFIVCYCRIVGVYTINNHQNNSQPRNINL